MILPKDSLVPGPESAPRSLWARSTQHQRVFWPLVKPKNSKTQVLSQLFAPKYCFIPNLKLAFSKEDSESDLSTVVLTKVITKKVCNELLWGKNREWKKLHI